MCAQGGEKHARGVGRGEGNQPWREKTRETTGNDSGFSCLFFPALSDSIFVLQFFLLVLI